MHKEFKDTIFTDVLVYFVFYIEEMCQFILNSSVLPQILVVLHTTP